MASINRIRWRPALSRSQLAPATGAVVRDDLLEDGCKGGSVDLLALPNGDGTAGLVILSAGDHALWVRYNPAVVQENINPAFGRQQRADVAIERKIRQARALDGLYHLRIRGMNQTADLLADGLLPLWQAFDISIDAWIGIVSRHFS